MKNVAFRLLLTVLLGGCAIILFGEHVIDVALSDLGIAGIIIGAVLTFVGLSLRDNTSPTAQAAASAMVIIGLFLSVGGIASVIQAPAFVYAAMVVVFVLAGFLLLLRRKSKRGGANPETGEPDDLPNCPVIYVDNQPPKASNKQIRDALDSKNPVTVVTSDKNYEPPRHGPLCWFVMFIGAAILVCAFTIVPEGASVPALFVGAILLIASLVTRTNYVWKFRINPSTNQCEWEFEPGPKH